MLGVFHHREPGKPNRDKLRGNSSITGHFPTSASLANSTHPQINYCDFTCHATSSSSSSTAGHSDSSPPVVSPASTMQADPDEPQDLSLRPRRQEAEHSTNGNHSSPDQSQCSICHATFTDLQRLIRHLNETHGIGNTDFDNRPRVNGDQASANGLRNETYTKPDVPPTIYGQAAGVDTNSPSTLPFCCPLCNVICSSDSNFIEHLLSHSGAENGAEPNHPFAQVASSDLKSDPCQVPNSESTIGATYCELCNKEFCNTWFLKTHKAKVHGVVSDEMDDFSNTTVLAPTNEDRTHQTASPAFDPTNSISAFPFSSTTQLQGSPMAGFGGQQNACPFCHQLFPNYVMVQNHLLTGHASLLMNAAAVLYAAGLLWVNPFGGVGGVGSGNGGVFPNPQTNGKQQQQQQQMAAIATAAAMLGFGVTPTNPITSLPTSTGTPFDYYSQEMQQHIPGLLGQTPAPSLTSVSGTLQNAKSTGYQYQGIMGNFEEKTSLLMPTTPAKNPDAYCEICQKEFCNKYFLRTHRLNKHGILDESPKSISGLAIGTGGKVGKNGNKSPTPTSFSQRDDGRTESIFSTILAPVAKRPLDGGTSPPSKLPKLDNEEEASSTMTAPISIGQFPCNLCVKTFPSMFALVAHKYRDHGTFDGATAAAVSGLIQNSSPAGQSNSTSSSPLNFGQTSKQRRPKKSIENDPQDLSLSSMNNLTSAPQSVDLEAYCEICQKEFCSKYFLKVHKANIHGLGASTPIGLVTTNGHKSKAFNGNTSMMSPFTCGTPGVLNLQAALNWDSTDPNRIATSGANSVAALMSAAVGATAGRPLVASKNFCDICNKELCNKYFLRTHMLKMHGIVIDENKTVIANINTLDKEKNGELLFRCDLCGEQLASRQQLRAHKHNVHQISIPPPTSSTASNSTASDGDTSPTGGHVATENINVIKPEACDAIQCNEPATEENENKVETPAAYEISPAVMEENGINFGMLTEAIVHIDPAGGASPVQDDLEENGESASSVFENVNQENEMEKICGENESAVQAFNGSAMENMYGEMAELKPAGETSD